MNNLKTINKQNKSLEKAEIKELKEYNNKIDDPTTNLNHIYDKNKTLLNTNNQRFKSYYYRSSNKKDNN